MASFTVTIKPQARSSYIAFSYIYRTFATASVPQSSSQFRRSDFTGQPFTGSYEPDQKTYGPLGDASILGAPKLTPRVLKQHLDQFVVGQERAKKVLSVAVYNHYQRVQELERREEEEEQLLQQRLRREMDDGHPLEGTIVPIGPEQVLIYVQTNSLAIDKPYLCIRPRHPSAALHCSIPRPPRLTRRTSFSSAPRALARL